MLFNSLHYLFFLPIIFLTYWLIPHKFRWLLLLAASYYFYMSWNAKLIVLIGTTTIISYLTALFIEKSKGKKQKKTFLLIASVGSLGILFFYKYFNFFSVSITGFLKSISLPVDDFTLTLMLPVGISFYTFQTLSYVIDVYNGKIKAEKHFGIYALYVSFFPQLVAGPIERASALLPQFHKKAVFSTSQTSDGLRKIMIGFVKKVVIADFVAQFVNNVYNDLSAFGGVTLWIATFLFAVQIYCDFSGYSDIAIGSAQLLGFKLMENFKSPYLALSIRDFWRRWHISLTTWFTDYIYIPLGGNRRGKIRTNINLLITFMCSGLWHGASWNFILWGLWHGIWLCIERLYIQKVDCFQQKNKEKFIGKIIAVFRGISTFVIVCFGWVLFRANTLDDVFYILTTFFNGMNVFKITVYAALAGISSLQLGIISLMILFIIIYDWVSFYKVSVLSLIKNKKPFCRYIFYYLLCFSVLLSLFFRQRGVEVDFIYFQF